MADVSTKFEAEFAEVNQRLTMDGCVVINLVDPGGHVGESTQREIACAESLGKPVRYLSRERMARTGDGPQLELVPVG